MVSNILIKINNFIQIYIIEFEKKLSVTQPSSEKGCAEKTKKQRKVRITTWLIILNLKFIQQFTKDH